MKRPAIFLDRDGTIIEDAGYIGDPRQVRLLPDAAEAIRHFRGAGFLVVIVSNQSGVARGRFDTAAMKNVHARVETLLAEHGASVDRAYYCPFLDGPEATVEAYRRDSDLRKPRPGMLRLAAKELEIDLSRSWMIGNSVTDVQAGSSAGCRTILLCQNGAPVPALAKPPTHCTASLTEAAILVEQAMSEQRELVPPLPLGEGRGEGKSSDDAVIRALEKIQNQLERGQRKDRQHDFSSLRLFGALLQMLAIVAAMWGVVALLDDQSPPATARLILACFFQLAAVTAFAIDRFR